MRLDHLLSKEHLQPPCRALCPCGGVVRSTPVAQTLVLRRVLTGGISTNSGRRFFAGTQYGPLCFLWKSGWSWNGAGEVMGGLVFGTLLGPEATGPRYGFLVPFRGCGGLWCGTCVSGFLAAPITRLFCSFGGGVCVGCVVRGCCLRTT